MLAPTIKLQIHYTELKGKWSYSFKSKTYSSILRNLILIGVTHLKGKCLGIGGGAAPPIPRHFLIEMRKS